MKLVKLDVKARCDNYLCRNLAEYRIATGSGAFSRLLGGSGLYFCRNCLTELYAAIGKEIIPKSPDNLIKKAVKRREENEGKQ